MFLFTLLQEPLLRHVVCWPLVWYAINTRCPLTRLPNVLSLIVNDN